MLAPGCFGHGMGRPAQKARARSRSCSTSLGIDWRFYSLDLPKHSQEIAAEDFFDVRFRQAALEQACGQPRQAGCRLQLFRQRWHSIEVAADADVFDARDFHRVQDVLDNVLEL